MHSKVKSEKALEDEANQTPENHIINVDDERRDKTERDAGGARYTSKSRLLKEHLESYGEQV